VLPVAALFVVPEAAAVPRLMAGVASGKTQVTLRLEQKSGIVVRSLEASAAPETVGVKAQKAVTNAKRKREARFDPMMNPMGFSPVLEHCKPRALGAIPRSRPGFNADQ